MPDTSIYAGLSRRSPAIVNITRMACAASMKPGSQGDWTGVCMHEQ